MVSNLPLSTDLTLKNVPTISQLRRCNKWLEEIESCVLLADLLERPHTASREEITLYVSFEWIASLTSTVRILNKFYLDPKS